MAESDLIAGMDEEGLRRTLGELLAANRGTQANFDEIRQQFPIQPSSVAGSIPTWEELEEGGLEPPEEGGSFDEQLEVPLAGFAESVRVEVAANGAIVNGGVGLTIEHPSTGIYKIWINNPSSPDSFQWPSDIRSLSPSTSGSQAVSGNVNPLKVGGKRGWEIVLVKNVSETAYVDAQFHFSAANFAAE
jgi:hypothetical protein